MTCGSFCDSLHLSQHGRSGVTGALVWYWVERDLQETQLQCHHSILQCNLQIEWAQHEREVVLHTEVGYIVWGVENHMYWGGP